jgi:putative ABC transport system permease protein
MSLAPRLASLWRNLLRKTRVERDLDEEVRGYVELLTADKIKSGLSPEEARRQAMIETGGTEQVKEQVREVRFGAFFETLLQDVRYGLRQLRRSPGFTAVAIVTLALGIGANTAIFSVIDASLLRPLPYEHSEGLVNVTMLARRGQRLVVAPHFVAWRDESKLLDGIGAFGIGFNGYGNGANLTGVGDPVRIKIAPVTVEFFRLLGVQPVLGRDFVAEEGEQGRSHVLLLSAAVWRQNFGASPRIIGKSVNLDGTPYTVVGVMPAGLVYPPEEAWVPEVLDASNSLPSSPDFPLLTVIGRLKPGASIEQARSELRVITDRLNKEITPAGRAHAFSQWSVEVVPLHALLAGDVRGLLFILLAAVGFVLLIASANVANLLLVRAASRAREVAIRAALGAGRARLIQQLMTESVLLAVSGGVLGLVLGFWAVDAMKQLIPPSLPADVRLDWRVLLFAVVATAASVLFFGLLPALVASRPDLSTASRAEAAPSSRVPRARRLRGSLVVTEIALSMVLLAGAGLLVRSFWRLTETDPGFDASHVFLADCWLPVTMVSDTERQAAFFTQVLERLRALPEVEQAGATTHYPMSIFNALSSNLEIAGAPAVELGEPISIASVSPDYFRAMGIPLVKGWFFNQDDGGRARNVAIITESVARGAFPGRDVINRAISTDGPKGPWRTVVGVVTDTRNYALDREPWPEIYVPYMQSPSFFMTFAVRTSGDPALVSPALKRAVASADRNQSVSNLQTMAELMEKAIAPRRFKMILLGAFAGLALLLALVGLYGVVSYSVTQRTHEIGVRVALGAGRGEIMRLILVKGIVLMGAGLGAGLAGASALTRYLTGLLYTVTPSDPLTFAAVSLLLTLVALLACYIPARRATKVEPTAALRNE